MPRPPKKIDELIARAAGTLNRSRDGELNHVPKRPFGFLRSGSTDIDFDDIVRIGKADWGYFSSWMYGVPESALRRSGTAPSR